MKRLIFGTLAIVMAAAAAAFTTPTASKASLDDAYFAFDIANHLPTIENVEDPAKWIKVLDATGCPSDEELACKMRVGSAHYSGSTLQSSINITANESAPGVAYVAFSEAQQVYNRENP